MSFELILDSDISYQLLEQCPLISIRMMVCLTKTMYRRLCGIFTDVKITKILWRANKLIFLNVRSTPIELFCISEFKIFNLGEPCLQITKNICPCGISLNEPPNIFNLSQASSRIFAILYNKAPDGFPPRLCGNCRMIYYST